MRHLTVHPPAAGDGPAAARAQSAKAAPRPGFVELLRAPQRPASRRPASGPGRGDALPSDALPMPESPTGVAVADVADVVDVVDAPNAPDAPEEARTAPAPWAIDLAIDPENPGIDTGLLDEPQPVDAPPSREPGGADEVDALEADPRERAIVRYLAATVADFCNDPDVHAGDGWTVRLLLNDTILPSTTLHLSLSLHWLLLRFECGDAQSKELINAHRDALQHALEEAVSPRREVSIDLD